MAPEGACGFFHGGADHQRNTTTGDRSTAPRYQTALSACLDRHIRRADHLCGERLAGQMTRFIYQNEYYKIIFNYF